MKTDAELMEMEERNWLRVDAALRDKCVWHLRETIPADQQAELRRAFEAHGWPPGFHMFGGMAVRNALRKVVRDEELPAVEYTHVVIDDRSNYDGPVSENWHPLCRNWDDFYMAALRQAVAPKDGEV